MDVTADKVKDDVLSAKEIGKVFGVVSDDNMGTEAPYIICISRAAGRGHLTSALCRAARSSATAVLSCGKPLAGV